MKKILLLAIFAVSLFASDIKIGDTFPNFSYEDQFKAKHTLQDSTKIIIIAFTRDGGNVVRDALSDKEKGFLESKEALYIADISGMPSFISSFFAIPKMKKYPFNILLEKENSLLKVYPNKAEKVTIIKLTNKKIDSIEYISTSNELLKSLK
jgi:hypothetical protein